MKFINFEARNTDIGKKDGVRAASDTAFVTVKLTEYLRL